VKRFPCEETTIDLHSGPFHVRLWMTNHHAAFDQMTMADWSMSFLRRELSHSREWTSEDIGPTPCIKLAEAFARSGNEQLAAVQVTRPLPGGEGRIGHMIYTVPFDEDRLT